MQHHGIENLIDCPQVAALDGWGQDKVSFFKHIRGVELRGRFRFYKGMNRCWDLSSAMQVILEHNGLQFSDVSDVCLIRCMSDMCPS